MNRCQGEITETNLPVVVVDDDPLSLDVAVSILRESGYAGRTRPEHFDPRLLKVFREMSPAFDTIFSETS